MKYDAGKKRAAQTREARSVQGSRFRILLSDAGLSLDEAAKHLHVTPRTIRYWVSGKVTVPYSAYKLLRVMRLFELPCEGWDGWHMHSGRLWSPEGHGFVPSDSNWWGLLVRKARLFEQMYEREGQFRALIDRMQGAGSDAVTPVQGELARTDGGGAARPNDAVGRAA